MRQVQELRDVQHEKSMLVLRGEMTPEFLKEHASLAHRLEEQMAVARAAASKAEEWMKSCSEQIEEAKVRPFPLQSQCWHLNRRLILSWFFLKNNNNRHMRKSVRFLCWLLFPQRLMRLAMTDKKKHDEAKESEMALRLIFPFLSLAFVLDVFFNAPSFFSNRVTLLEDELASSRAKVFDLKQVCFRPLVKLA